MPRSRTSRAAAAGALGVVLAATAAGSSACSAGDPTRDPAGGPTSVGPSQAPFPADLTAYVDQSRRERVGRAVFVRLVHDDVGDGTITALRAEVSSERFASVTWTGDKTFMNEADLDVELPLGTCGTGSDAEVRLTYRVDDGPEVVSTVRATDRYGAIGLFLDRDCAEQTMGQAAVIEVGEPVVVGTGRSSTFDLPVTFTATGERDDVAFTGFDSTVLFRVASISPPVSADAPLVLGEGVSRTVVLSVRPGRCDPHALAEDKVGTLFPTSLSAPGLPPGAAFYLPLPEAARAALRRFVPVNCGW